MATDSFIGSQSLLKLGTLSSPITYTTIGEVTSIGPISQKKDLVEVTHMLSTAKEYIGGLSDGQEMSVVCNFIPADTEQLALITAGQTTSTAQNFQYVANNNGTPKTFTFAALVLSYSVGPTEPNKAVQITFGLKISGAVVGPS